MKLKRIDLTHDQCVELADLQDEVFEMFVEQRQGLILAQVYPLKKVMSVAVVEHDVALRLIEIMDLAREGK